MADVGVDSLYKELSKCEAEPRMQPITITQTGRQASLLQRQGRSTYQL